MGSRRTLPCAPSAAAVISDSHGCAYIDPRTPIECLKYQWHGAGPTAAKNDGADGNPVWIFPRWVNCGHWDAGAVNRALGCAALAPVSAAIWGVHLVPCQLIHSDGGSSVMPSHHTPPSGVSATLVKIVFFRHGSHSVGIGLYRGTGATPKKTSLRIDRSQFTSLIRSNPGNIVADPSRFSTFKSLGRNHHGEIGPSRTH